MKRLSGAFLIGALFVLAGTVWGLTLSGVGTLEWRLLLSGAVLGIVAGLVQGRALSLRRRGVIGLGESALWAAGSIVALVIAKVVVNLSLPSYLSTSQNGIWLSVVFAAGGLLLGRAFYSRVRRAEPSRALR